MWSWGCLLWGKCVHGEFTETWQRSDTPPSSWLFDRSEITGTQRHVVFILLSAARLGGNLRRCCTPSSERLEVKEERSRDGWYLYSHRGWRTQERVSGPRGKNKTGINSSHSVVTRKRLPHFLSGSSVQDISPNTDPCLRQPRAKSNIYLSRWSRDDPTC